MIIQPTAKGGRIVWDSEDWISGLAPNYSASTASYQKGNKQLGAARSMNPFRSYGNAYPGYLQTDVTNVSEISDLALKGLVYGSNAYIVTLGDKLQKLDLGTNTLTAGYQAISTTASHGIHASFVGSDCAIYTAKVGGTSATRYFYSWYDDTDWDVGILNLDAGTFDSDFMSTAPITPLNTTTYAAGKSYPHPLIVGSDDILYIGDRNFVHALDGQNSADNDGKFFPAVLTLPGGFIITSFARTQLGLMIFGYLLNPQGVGNSYLYKGRSTAYSWDYVSLDITSAYDLNDNFTTEAFSYKGTVGCFTQGGSKDPAQSLKLCKLQLFNGSIFETVQTFIGNPPVRGGVDIVGDAISFNSSGLVHYYGSPLFGVKTGLNKLSEGTGTTSGMLSTFTGSTQYISSGTTTSGGLQYYTPTSYFADSHLATPVAEPSFPIGQRGRVKYVKVTYDNTTTSGNSRALSVLLRPRNGSNASVTSNVTSVTAGPDDTYLDTSGNALPVFEAIKLILQWSSGNGSTDAPGVSSVELVYENVNI